MIKFTINLTFLENIKSADSLTYLTVVLAYLAYSKSINDKYEYWKSLLTSLTTDLKEFESWLGNEYFEDSYSMKKDSWDPRKIILPLSFESLKEIIKRGFDAELKFTEDLSSKMSIFNERVEAFNKLLDQQRLNVTADPILTYKLRNKLCDLGIGDDSVDSKEFLRAVKNLESDSNSKDLYALAKQIQSINNAIHVNLISNASDENGLFSLRKFILDKIEEKLRKFNKQKPWYIRYRIPLIIASFVAFIVLENILK